MQTLASIAEQHLCTDVSAAGRIARRKRAQGDCRPLALRFPLLEVPPEVSSLVGAGLGAAGPPRTRFLAAASQAASLPLPGLPEVAFAGRSNVGKSSLINALTLSSVARQSDKPGKTQSLNVYAVAHRLSLVDLPGYGFAFAQGERVSRWNELIDTFLAGRGKALKRVLVVLDARHGVKVNDREMLLFLSASGVRFQVVLNKTDTVKPQELARRHSAVSAELAKLKGAHPTIHMLSTATGAGVAALATDLFRLAAPPGSVGVATPTPSVSGEDARLPRLAAAAGEGGLAATRKVWNRGAPQTDKDGPAVAPGAMQPRRRRPAITRRPERRAPSMM